MYRLIDEKDYKDIDELLNTDCLAELIHALDFEFTYFPETASEKKFTVYVEKYGKNKAIDIYFSEHNPLYRHDSLNFKMQIHKYFYGFTSYEKTRSGKTSLKSYCFSDYIDFVNALKQKIRVYERELNK